MLFHPKNSNKQHRQHSDARINKEPSKPIGILSRCDLARRFILRYRLSRGTVSRMLLFAQDWLVSLWFDLDGSTAFGTADAFPNMAFVGVKDRSVRRTANVDHWAYLRQSGAEIVAL